MKKVTVLLTKYNDPFSVFIYYFCGRGYTHCSLSLDDEPDVFYSFNRRGLVIETAEKHIRHGVICSRAIQFEVTDEVHAQLKARIQTFLYHRSDYRYSVLGVLLCILRISWKLKQQYFCSQFVAELLRDSGAISLPRAPEWYRPKDLTAIILAECCILCILENPLQNNGFSLASKSSQASFPPLQNVVQYIYPNETMGGWNICGVNWKNVVKLIWRMVKTSI